MKDELPRSVGAQYATGDQWRTNSRKNEVMEPKKKQHPVVHVTGDANKVRCCEEQYCIGTSMLGPRIKVNWKWSNRRWQENIDVLEISELKWTGISDFKADDHYIYYCGEESLRKNIVANIVNKRV